ncbi:cysteine dioxygenase family protein [Saccharomonospora sp. NPDC006951]
MTALTAELDIHPGLDTASLRALLDHQRPLWTPQQLRELTSFTATRLADPLTGLLRYVPEKRWWLRLGLTRGVELWLLTWLPGQGTPPHDHGGAAGSFTVLTGSLTESYRYPGGPIRLASRRAATAVGFGAGHAHQVTNTGEVPSASVHAYSPPLVPTRQYPSLADIPAEIPPLPALDLTFDQLKARADLEGP